MEQAQIIGNLGNDPDIKYLQDGKLVVNFSVAVNRKVSGEKRTTWYRVACWGQTAENVANLAEHGWLAKGRQVFVQGTLGLNTFTTQDGETRSNMEIMAYTVQLLGSQQPGDE